MFLKISLGTLALVGIVAYLLYRKRYRGLGLALAMCILTIVIGVWAIFQSRSSTAAIGILFLPFYGLFAGGMAWLYKNLRYSERKIFHFIGWISLALSVATPALLAYNGVETISRNQTRDAMHQADLATIKRNKQFISETLATNPGRESETIEGLITAHVGDRNFLLPLLESKFVAPATLDRLANADDFGITQTALRNPACRAETLVRIYRTHSNPSYFFQTLASHENTPPEILSEIYRRPEMINGLDGAFAMNPSTPPTVLQEIISKTKDSYVVQRLLQNPKMDCRQLGLIEEALKRTERPNDNFSVAQIQALKTGLCRGQ